MQALLGVVLPVFLVLGAGYLAVRAGVMSDAAADALMSFAQNFAIPCLLFLAIARLDLSQSFDLPLLFCFYAGATTAFAAGIAAARLLFGRTWPEAVAIGLSCLFSNSVLLGLPITERAYGTAALAGNYGIIALHSPYCYLLGTVVMESVLSGKGGPLRAGLAVARAMARNPIILGIAAGLVVNVARIPIPGVAEEATAMIARAGLPTALFALGGVIARYRPQGDMRVIAMVTAVSLTLHPAITWALAQAVSLDVAGMRSAVVTAAMAPGVNTYIFANLYGQARRVAASSVLIATALSVGTIWVWLLVLP